MIKLAVFCSGGGSNFNAILESISAGKLEAQVKAVFTNKEGCGAVEIARRHNIPVFPVSSTEKTGYYSYSVLPELLKRAEADLIVLAGFLKKIPDEVVDIFENRIINIHPALLPSFGGPGMYGMNVHNAVFNSSVKVSGATVHFVNKVYDSGKIIAQQCVDISDAASPEEIAKRVLKVEHKLLSYVIQKISENKVRHEGGRVIII